MLKVTRGFNYGLDDVRVEAGAELADDALPADVAAELYAKGVIVPIEPAAEKPADEAEPPAPARKGSTRTQKTTADAAAVTEAEGA
jgi:hypothetical protein